MYPKGPLFLPKVANGKFQNVFPLRLVQKRSVSLALSACVFARVCIYITRRLLFAVRRTLLLRKHSHARRSAMGDVNEDNLVQ